MCPNPFIEFDCSVDLQKLDFVMTYKASVYKRFGSNLQLILNDEGNDVKYEKNKEILSFT